MEQYVANVTILYLVKTPETPLEVLPLFGQRPNNGCSRIRILERSEIFICNYERIHHINLVSLLSNLNSVYMLDIVPQNK